MAISPPSDIILDVARAVEPAGLDAARAALARRAGTVAPTGADAAFAPLLGEATRLSRDSDAAGKQEAYKRFEAVVLQTFVQGMLPKEADSIYGKGIAGDMWKSMMAERIAGVMADHGGIGIASHLLADHYVEGEKRLSLGPVSQGLDGTVADAQTAMSTALVHELERRAAGAIGRSDGTAGNTGEL